MKPKSLILLFTIALSFLSCSNHRVDKNNAEISEDFPTSANLELQFFNEYNVLSRVHDCFVDDSVLWVILEDDNNNLGYCFDLNKKTQLSTIATRGKASYEFDHVHKVIILGDSIQLHTELDVIKTFAKKDIIENKPMDQRLFSVTPSLDTIFACEKIKLPNGSVLATMCGIKYQRGASFNNDYKKYFRSEFNQKMVAIINFNEANAYRTVNYEKFNIEKHPQMTDDLDFRIKFAFASSHIGLKGNDMAVFCPNNLLFLYTLDLNTKKVVKEKVYTKLITNQFGVINDMELRTLSMKCNDKYIVCHVRGYLSQEDKEAKKLKNTILVFDWDLNPVKKLNLPDLERESGERYFIAEDCRAIYSWKMNDEGLVLSKVELNY